MKYFSHKEFKHFFKRIKHDKCSIHMFYVENNSLDLPPFVISKRIKFKTLKHELWENQAIHHYVINDKYSFEIPADAFADHSRLQFSYRWTYSGPYNCIRFSRMLYNA